MTTPGPQRGSTVVGMAALIVLAAVALLMVVLFTRFYRHSRTPEWGDSETRKAFLGMLMAIGPFFGLRYEPRQPTPTEISTPYRGDEPDMPSDDGAEHGTPEPRQGTRRPARGGGGGGGEKSGPTN